MNKKKNLLLNNIMRVLSANFLVTMVGFVGSFIFPKILSIESYAVYHTYLLYVGYIAILHLGFPSGMVINYAGKNYDTLDKQQYKSEIKILSIILVSFTICFGIISIILQNKILAYVALSIIPVCWLASYKSLVQAWSRFEKYMFINIFVSVGIPICAIVYYLIFKQLPGEIYIIIYLIINWISTIFLWGKAFIELMGIKSERMLSQKNGETEKIGILICLGNYINTLFISADKQFVGWFFGKTEFAFYSFGISMQAIMVVFITSMAQPLFPMMAQGKFTNKDYNKIKELLLIFGSFSGCAYFVVSIIIHTFIEKYAGSIEIIGIYFVVFPAMAVINCLYINLYKIKGMMKTYIWTLIGILGIAIILNLIAANIFNNSRGIAMATIITYYIWLFLGAYQFKFIKINRTDLIFLICYICTFFLITQNLSDIWGGIVYFIVICLLAWFCYRHNLKKFKFFKGEEDCER